MSDTKGVAVGGEKANPTNGVALVNGADVPAKFGQWDPKAKLKMRLLKSQSDVSTLDQDAKITGVGKSGKEFTYMGISSAQVVAVAKSVLISNGILYTTEVDKASVKIDGNKTSFWLSGHFENVDDDRDTMTCGAWGSGTDNADNGYVKAYTNANKQILTKQLQMTTKEDERFIEVQHETEVANVVREEARQDKKGTLQAWALNFKAAVTNAKTVKELTKLQSDNREQLMSDDTPPITREFFIDLIEGRKNMLEAAANA